MARSVFLENNIRFKLKLYILPGYSSLYFNTEFYPRFDWSQKWSKPNTVVYIYSHIFRKYNELRLDVDREHWLLNQL